MQIVKSYSAPGQISVYDIWSVIRTVLFLSLAFVVTNIDLIQSLLADYNVDSSIASFITFMIIELGRKYVKDYSYEAPSAEDLLNDL